MQKSLLEQSALLNVLHWNFSGTATPSWLPKRLCGMQPSSSQLFASHELTRLAWGVCDKTTTAKDISSLLPIFFFPVALQPNFGPWPPPWNFPFHFSY
jgi:hypothetical protein